MLRINLLFLIDWISHVAKQKINTKTTHEFFKIKLLTIFHVFQFHIRRTQQKSPSFSKFTLDYHSSSITQNQPYSKIREEYHIENNPRPWRWWYHGNDSTQDRRRFWGREFIRRHRGLCFIFDRGCDLIYVSFRN